MNPRREPERRRGRIAAVPREGSNSPASVHIHELDDETLVTRRTGRRGTFVGIIGPPPKRKPRGDQ